mmetsp:Transcript_15502/g.34866  ORF Transcript_15502/g.34866 Transcript_15502/m.34866 type:complete len:369 (-) Transcript_15502:565-1671(-)
MGTISSKSECSGSDKSNNNLGGGHEIRSSVMHDPIQVSTASNRNFHFEKIEEDHNNEGQVPILPKKLCERVSSDLIIPTSLVGGKLTSNLISSSLTKKDNSDSPMIQETFSFEDSKQNINHPKLHKNNMPIINQETERGEKHAFLDPVVNVDSYDISQNEASINLSNRINSSVPLPTTADDISRRKNNNKNQCCKTNSKKHVTNQSYRDFSSLLSETALCHNFQRRRGRGHAVQFPEKLYLMLEDISLRGLDHIASWREHGRTFCVHNMKEFQNILEEYLGKRIKLTSFNRQLNIYGFTRLRQGRDKGCYYHELFLRGFPGLCCKIERRSINKMISKSPSNQLVEPDFYSMPYVGQNIVKMATKVKYS